MLNEWNSKRGREESRGLRRPAKTHNAQQDWHGAAPNINLGFRWFCLLAYFA